MERNSRLYGSSTGNTQAVAEKNAHDLKTTDVLNIREVDLSAK